MPIKSVKMKNENFEKCVFFSCPKDDLTQKLGSSVKRCAMQPAYRQTHGHGSEYRGHPFMVSGIFPSAYHQGSIQKSGFVTFLLEPWCVFLNRQATYLSYYVFGHGFLSLQTLKLNEKNQFFTGFRIKSVFIVLLILLFCVFFILRRLGCYMDGQHYKFGAKWSPELMPQGIMVCIKCECLPVSI